MSVIWTRLSRAWNDESGLEKIEYAILAGLIVAWLIGIIVTLGVAVRQYFRRLGGELDW